MLPDKLTKLEYYRFNLRDISDNENGFVIGRYDENNILQQIHTHGFIQIYYIAEGTLRHKVNDETSILAKGDIFILPPDIYHAIENVERKKLTYISIGFMPEFIDFSCQKHASFMDKFIRFILSEQHIQSDLPIRPKISFAGETLIQVEKVIKAMLQEYSAKKEGHHFFNKGQLLQLLVLIAREYVTTPYYLQNKNKFDAYNEAIISCIDYVNQNFRQDLKIDSLAKSFYLSRTYFCKLFKSYTGKSFNTYINDLRISYSKQLLDSSETNITDISYDAGFNDISSFCRKFKEQFGISPSEYRKIK